jgi:hypothetical protein
MKTWVLIVALATSLAIWTLWQDAQERVKAAQAQAWYRSTEQANVRDVHSQREESWRLFKECVKNGDTVANCIYLQE